MKAKHSVYNFEQSLERIDNILKTDYRSYKVLKSIPSRDELSCTNGFYVMCTALYVDVRIPSKLSERYHEATLAKIYRSYISEVVAILNGNNNCAEVNIEGNSVWGIFDTPHKEEMDSVLCTAARVSSIIDILNSKYRKKDIDPITVGIGIDYGRALMMKAGHNGSEIDEIVWMGEVINSASRLCSYGNKRRYDKEVMVSNVFYNNISADKRELLEWNDTYYCYHGNIMNVYMSEWIEKTADLILY